MTNNRLSLNANKTDFVIIGTYPDNATNVFVYSLRTSLLVVASHHQTRTVLNIDVTFDSEFSFIKHISLTYVASAFIIFVTIVVFVTIFLFQSPKPLLQYSIITTRLDYWNSLLYNIASNDFLN